MRLILTIIFLINFAKPLFAQSTDTTRQDTILLLPTTINPAVILIWDSLGIHFTNSGTQNTYVTHVPTCSCLKLRNGKYYLENDTIPYQGTCIVTEINKPGDYLVISNYYSGFDIKNIICPKSDHVKIISRYTDGKRDGEREYYDKKGNLIKTEIYANGKLIKTTYP